MLIVETEVEEVCRVCVVCAQVERSMRRHYGSQERATVHAFVAHARAVVRPGVAEATRRRAEAVLALFVHSVTLGK